jgi:hypothetical protein
MAVEFTEDEKRKLVESFIAMGQKPKADSESDLKGWMMGYAEEHGKKPDATGYIPKIILFSGDKSQATTYAAWKYDVLNIKTQRPDAAELAAKRSLRGKAAEVIRRLGQEATLEQIIARFDILFGEVEEGEDIMSLFYSAKQGEKELISDWSCRLDEYIYRASQQDAVPAAESMSMLKHKFWSGLRQPLKDKLRHKYEGKPEYGVLLAEARKLENELEQDKPSSKKSVPCASCSAKENTAVASTQDENEVHGSSFLSLGQQQFAAAKPNTSGRTGNFKNQAPSYPSNFKDQAPSYPSNFKNQAPSYPSNFKNQAPSYPLPPPRFDPRHVRCWRCGEEGHIRLGCRNPEVANQGPTQSSGVPNQQMNYGPPPSCPQMSYGSPSPQSTWNPVSAQQHVSWPSCPPPHQSLNWNQPLPREEPEVQNYIPPQNQPLQR